MVVIDEQHRFGVEQRAALRAKGTDTQGEGADPDLLVMTATPIPRTAAMVVFGDLDMTLLDELPAGRTPVHTAWSAPDDDEAWQMVRQEVAAGHRAYVVCPLVEGSETCPGDVGHRGEGAPRIDRPGRFAHRPAARAAQGGRQRGRYGRLSPGRDRGAGGHHRDRGRGGRPRGHGHGHRGRRPVRDRPAPSAAGQGGALRPAVVVLPAGRRPSRPTSPPAWRPS